MPLKLAPPNIPKAEEKKDDEKQDKKEDPNEEKRKAILETINSIIEADKKKIADLKN